MTRRSGKDGQSDEDVFNFNIQTKVYKKHREINLCLLLFVFLIWNMFQTATSHLTILSTNETYIHRIASYGPLLNDTGINASLFVFSTHDPSNSKGCSISNLNIEVPWIALVQQGGCSFLTKTKNAQAMGAVALIVGSDNPYMGLITMDSDSDTSDVRIPSVYISFYDYLDLEWKSRDQFPNYESFLVNLARYDVKYWPVVNIIIARILAPAIIMILLYTCAFKCRERRKKQRMKAKEDLVANLPKRRFVKGEGEDTDCCAICLEEYVNDVELRTLPCKHEFHVQCVDTWLIERKRFCPLCKMDAFPNEESNLV